MVSCLIIAHPQTINPDRFLMICRGYLLFLSLCFIASFAFVLQRQVASPVPCKDIRKKGSPLGRAPAVAGERVIKVDHLPSPSATPPPLPKGEAFSLVPFKQIGRKNYLSAEIFVSAVSPLRMQREPKILF